MRVALTLLLLIAESSLAGDSLSDKVARIGAGAAEHSRLDSLPLDSRSIGYCHAVYYNDDATRPYEASILSPEDVAILYFELYEGGKLNGVSVDSFRKRPLIGDVILEVPPKHGKIIVAPSGENRALSYQYTPDFGYTGEDHSIFVVAVNGVPVTVVYVHSVSELWPESEGVAERLCRGRTFWKIEKVSE